MKLYILKIKLRQNFKSKSHQFIVAKKLMTQCCVNGQIQHNHAHNHIKWIASYRPQLLSKADNKRTGGKQNLKCCARTEPTQLRARGPASVPTRHCFPLVWVMKCSSLQLLQHDVTARRMTDWLPADVTALGLPSCWACVSVCACLWECVHMLGLA